MGRLRFTPQTTQTGLPVPPAQNRFRIGKTTALRTIPPLAQTEEEP